MNRPSGTRDGSPDNVRTRPPAVAGRFYPGQPRALAEMVDALLDAVPIPDGDRLGRAYVVPHAGFQYSGPTAATVYARLRRHAERIDRVVLLGPAHYVPLSGCAAPATDAWSTPLGAVRVDVGAIQELTAAGRVTVDDRPHVPEHSLEVQLPFLRRALPESVPVVPILVGVCPAEEVSATVAAALGGPGTVVLCSTDLSHYLDLAAAEERDARTARAVLDLRPDGIGTRDACGVFALRGLVDWARSSGHRASLLHRCTSADTTGDTSRVVGYGAFAFSRPTGGPAPGPRPPAG